MPLLTRTARHIIISWLFLALFTGKLVDLVLSDNELPSEQRGLQDVTYSEKTFAVGLTSIPPRFSMLHITLQSWLNQQLPVHRIYVFIPKRYRRFGRRPGENVGSDKDSNVTGKRRSHSTTLREELCKHNPNIAKALSVGIVTIVEVDKDWGPVTKFLGAIKVSQQLSQAYHTEVHGSQETQVPDYWVFCDDDVYYSDSLLAIYNIALKRTDCRIVAGECEKWPTQKYVGYTLFAETYRLKFLLDHETLEQRVAHIQGVDSYLIPTSALMLQPSYSLPHASQQRRPPDKQFADFATTVSNGAVTMTTDADAIPTNPTGSAMRRYTDNMLERTTSVVEYLHTLCSASFYQDDYVVSVILHLLGVDMKSLRDSLQTTAMIENIDGLSKNFFQMHMDESVFIRELTTQQCIMRNAMQLYNILFRA